MSVVEWLIAGITLVYLGTMGASLYYTIKTHKFWGKAHASRVMIVHIGITIWMALASASAFNVAIQGLGLPTNPAAAFFRVVIITVLPLIVSASLFVSARTLYNDFTGRLRQ